jgi:hypothetical protein
MSLSADPIIIMEVISNFIIFQMVKLINRNFQEQIFLFKITNLTDLLSSQARWYPCVPHQPFRNETQAGKSPRLLW